MANKLSLSNVLGQRQSLNQQQRLTMQQVKYMRLLEMPLQDLEQAVLKEIDDNPALFPLPDSNASSSQDKYLHDNQMQDYQASEQGGFHALSDEYEDEDMPLDYNSDGYDREGLRDAMKEALENMGRDDRMETSHRLVMERTLSNDETLYDELKEQISLLDINEKQERLMDYIVGALDEDGLLRRDAEFMVEELAVYQGIETTKEEVEAMIKLFKSLDPAGIGAQSLQECLLIQVDRRKKSAATAVMKRILKDYFDEFIHDEWTEIYESIDEDEELLNEAFDEIRKLNPRPGAGLVETVRDKGQDIQPDFIVEISDDGEPTFTLNTGKIPQLALAEDFEDIIRKYEGIDRNKLRKQEFEALRYANSNVRRAQAYIIMLQLRYRTLSMFMKAILERQRAFFLSGDDTDLKPMMMKEIAETMGYDVSTVSRSCSGKYVQTEWGVYPMKHFFVASYSQQDSGEERTLQQLLNAIRKLIDSENKQKPLSDEKLNQLLKKQGFDIARRTVAKYREQLGIKVARFRKQQ